MITATLLFSMPGGTELILIAGIVFFMFGGKKLPELMKGLGKGINEFKKAKDGVESEIRKEVEQIKE